MLKNLKKRSQGFTIIEVLIVLAIAGLILLIVFLAVPALQRNNRNTQRRSDVSNMLSAANEYMTNNNGNVPTTAAQIDNNYNNGFYGTTPAPLTGCVGANCNAHTNTDTVKIVTGAICGTAGAATASTRGVAVLFAVEDADGGAGTSQCVSS